MGMPPVDYATNNPFRARRSGSAAVVPPGPSVHSRRVEGRAPPRHRKAVRGESRNGLPDMVWAAPRCYHSTRFRPVVLPFLHSRPGRTPMERSCLLYTSDAADDLLCVDL